MSAFGLQSKSELKFESESDNVNGQLQPTFFFEGKNDAVQDNIPEEDIKVIPSSFEPTAAPPPAGAKEKKKSNKKTKKESLETSQHEFRKAKEANVKVVPSSFELIASLPAVEAMEKRKQNKKTKKETLETSQRELDKMKEIIQNSQSSDPQGEDPYVFSDDDEQRETREISVEKFYAKNSPKSPVSKKQTAPPKPQKTYEKQNQLNQHKVKQSMKAKPSANTIRKIETRKNVTGGYDEEFPDLIVENDSYSEYREREYKFFKSRNNYNDSFGTQASKKTSIVNISANASKLSKSRINENKENANRVEKTSLMFTSPVAGASKVAKVKANSQKNKGIAPNKGQKNKNKKKTAEAKYTENQSPEVCVTQLDSPEAPLTSPVKLSNINLAKSPELRPVVAEMKRADKNKGETTAKNSTTQKDYKQKVMEKIEKKMTEISAKAGKQVRTIRLIFFRFGNELIFTFDIAVVVKFPQKTTQKNSRRKQEKEDDVEIEDSDDANNE